MALVDWIPPPTIKRRMVERCQRYPDLFEVLKTILQPISSRFMGFHGSDVSLPFNRNLIEW